ncbi:hypothetical protein CPCC7001_761 [Cyanobium sp. PCC 7001]|nr:hypothetical protein CPCC7001_761 [Cyanobium sp. PCC 7001]
MWLRLRVVPPDQPGAAVATWRDPLHRQLLQQLDLDPALPLQWRAPVLGDPAHRLWLDRTSLGSGSAAAEALAALQAFLLRLVGIDGSLPAAVPAGTSLGVCGRARVLWSLLLLQRAMPSPAMELAVLAVTRSLLPALQAHGSPAVLPSLPLLLALVELGIHANLAETLGRRIGHRLPALPPGPRAQALCALVGLARHGAAPAGWLASLSSLVTQLAGDGAPRVAARTWCLAALQQAMALQGEEGEQVHGLVRTHAAGLVPSSLRPPPQTPLTLGSALRLALFSSVAAQLDGPGGPPPDRKLGERVLAALLARQCGPEQALESEQPQVVLGGSLAMGSGLLEPMPRVRLASQLPLLIGLLAWQSAWWEAAA